MILTISTISLGVLRIRYMKRLHLILIGATCGILANHLAAGPVSTQIFGWGYNGIGAATGIKPPAGQLDLESGAVWLARQPLTNIISIAAGYQHSLALQSDGTVLGWGFNNCGQATGSSDGTNGFVRINGVVLSNVVAISAGFLHSLALKSDGTVVAWGSSAYGETTVPEGLSNIVAVSAGWYHSLALKKDGKVVMWPNPIKEGWWSPTVLPSLTNIVAIATTKNLWGTGDDMVLKSDGTVVTWGIKSGHSHSITGVSNVVALAAGAEGLALTREGTVFEISLHSDADSHSEEARQHGGLTNVVAIAAGGSRCLALKREGTVTVVWGDNYPYLPSEPLHLTNVIGIAAGENFCLALQTNAP